MTLPNWGLPVELRYLAPSVEPVSLTRMVQALAQVRSTGILVFICVPLYHPRTSWKHYNPFLQQYTQYSYLRPAYTIFTDQSICFIFLYAFSVISKIQLETCREACTDYRLVIFTWKEQRLKIFEWGHAIRVLAVIYKSSHYFNWIRVFQAA